MKYRYTRRKIRRYKRVTLRTKVKQERRKKILWFFAAGLMLGAVCFGGWQAKKSLTTYIFNSKTFVIKEIEIRGNKNVSKSEIMALLPFRPGDNLFRLWLSSAEKKLSGCKPELKNIKISRGWHKVVVEFEEREPLACVVAGGQRFGLDRDNKPFPLRGQLIERALPQVIASSEKDRGKLLEFISVFAKTAQNVFPRAERFYFQAHNSVAFDLKAGPSVYWGEFEPEKINTKLKRLDQVLEDSKKRFSNLEYVNLFYFDDGRILVKPNPKVL
jgi:cell division septal protein FtsQ